MDAGEGMSVDLSVEVFENLLTETRSLGECYSCRCAGCGSFSSKFFKRIFIGARKIQNY
jgi:hypothetical protein